MVENDLTKRFVDEVAFLEKKWPWLLRREWFQAENISWEAAVDD